MSKDEALIRHVEEMGEQWPITLERLAEILEERAEFDEGLAMEFGGRSDLPIPKHNVARIEDGYYVCECSKRGGPVKPGDPPLEKLRSEP